MDYKDWRAALEELITAGLREHQPARIGAALASEAARVGRQPALPRPAKPVAPVTPVAAAAVLGVDACRAGWVGVVLRPGTAPVVLVAATVAELLELARPDGPVALVAVDIPIGLPDSGARQADALARKALPGKASSVFTTLTRAAYQAETYAEGREANKRATGGVSASAQAYALRTKILEVDAWVRSGPGVPVIEVHPELSFATLAGAPLLDSKKSAEGAAARRSVLGTAGLAAPAWSSGSGYDEDDLLDACAAAWTAQRHAAGTAESLPAEPEVFSDGLAAAIWR